MVLGLPQIPQGPTNDIFKLEKLYDARPIIKKELDWEVIEEEWDDIDFSD